MGFIDSIKFIVQKNTWHIIWLFFNIAFLVMAIVAIAAITTDYRCGHMCGIPGGVDSSDKTVPACKKNVCGNL